MENTDRLNSYLVLLRIRQKAYRRNVFLIGGLFLLAIFATTATLLFTEWNSRSIWLMGVFVVLFTVSFLMAWVRLEINNENIELLTSLKI